MCTLILVTCREGKCTYRVTVGRGFNDKHHENVRYIAVAIFFYVVYNAADCILKYLNMRMSNQNNIQISFKFPYLNTSSCI
jgi:hypothetical protein